MTIKKRIATLLLCIVLLFVIGGESILSAWSITASAETVQYSNVLDDLQKDKNFNVADYPAKADDYSLQVIQIAEGENGELFVYVYQPSKNTISLRAEKINLSLYEPSAKEPDFSLYKLTWLNSNGVFDKYVIDDFFVSDSEYRYYTISTIYRAYNALIDKESQDNFDINYKGESVAQSWCLYEDNGKLIYEKEHINVIEITPVLESFVFYEDSRLLPYPGIPTTGCYRHFYAFKPDNYVVEKIIDCIVSYKSQEISITAPGTSAEAMLKGPIESDSIKLSENSTCDYKGFGLFNKTYSWDRIMTKDLFLENLELHGIKYDKFSEQDLNDAEYVLSYLETEYVGSDAHVRYTSITEVTLIQLHFLSDGREYNLGVVTDIVSGSEDPFGIVQENHEELMAVLMFIALILVLFFLWDPICVFVKFVFNGVETLFTWCVIIIAFPFRCIGWFFKK